MQEYSFTFKEGLVRGLREKAHNDRNRQALVTAQNLRATEYGLRELDSVTDPFDSGDWPFPQWIFCRRYTLLATAAGVYTVNMTTYALTLAFTQASTSQWHVADYGTYILMTNGTNVWERDPDTDTWSEVT